MTGSPGGHPIGVAVGSYENVKVRATEKAGRFDDESR
jgi:hypothetical protein